MKPEVLQQEHFARFHLLRHAPGIRSRGGGREGAFLLQEPRQALCDRSEGISEIGFSLGPADVGADDDPRALIQQIVDGGQGRPDAGVVRDVSLIVERHVEVDAQENPLVRDVDVLDAEFGVAVLNRARDRRHCLEAS